MTPITFDPAESASRQRSERAQGPRESGGRRPSVLAFNLVLGVLSLGMGVAVGLPIVDGTLSELSGPGGLAMFIGSITGMAGTYLALVMVILASRMPALERILGQGGVIHWHRRLAPWPILLIAIHAVFLTIAYAEAANTGIMAEVGVIVNTFPHLVTATVALAIMLFIGFISIRAIRTRIPRENWWLIHLLMYVALFLSFAHEVVLGPSFVKHPLAQETWTIAWLFAVALVLTYRIGFPIFRTLRHQLKVVEVKPEGPGVVSIILKGRLLEKLTISGGQFFEWRFLTRDLWWQAHPFTVSALPKPPYLRMTVKGVGDFSRNLANIKIGTKIAIEGPYGSFTTFARRRAQVLLIAGGIGVTAVRSLLEDIPLKSRPIVVLRASNEQELVLSEEIEQLVRHRKGTIHRLIGSREEMSLESITRLVPDIAKRDVFICGSEGFVNHATDVAQRAGVTSDALHHEAYSI